MPHMIIEYTGNINITQPVADLFEKLHLILEKMLPTELASCKSRAVERPEFFVGNGDKKNAFVHIDLQVMSGRTEDTLNKVGEAVLETVRIFFKDAANELNLQITLKL